MNIGENVEKGFLTDEAGKRLLEKHFDNWSIFRELCPNGKEILSLYVLNGKFAFLIEKLPYAKKKISQGLRMKVFERDGFKCVVCGIQKNLTVDHIKPEFNGGTLEMDNLQTLCKSHNSAKGTRS